MASAIDGREAEVMALYQQGLGDRQIQDAMGISQHIICNWRKANKLKGNKPHILSRTETRPWLTAEVLQGYVDKGMTIRQISEATGWSQRTVSRRLVQVGMKGNKRDYKLSPQEDLSICWSCIHAYGDDCMEVPIKDRAWVKVVVIAEGHGHPDSPPFDVHQVKVCDRFEAGRRKPHIIDKNAAYRLMEAIMKKDVYPDTEIEEIWAKAKEAERV